MTVTTGGGTCTRSSPAQPPCPAGVCTYPDPKGVRYVGADTPEAAEGRPTLKANMLASALAAGRGGGNGPPSIGLGSLTRGPSRESTKCSEGENSEAWRRRRAQEHSALHTDTCTYHESADTQACFHTHISSGSDSSSVYTQHTQAAARQSVTTRAHERTPDAKSASIAAWTGLGSNSFVDFTFSSDSSRSRRSS